LITAVLAYTYRWWFFPGLRLLHLNIIDDWSVATGVCIFISFALSSKKVSRILISEPLPFLGKISYSVYLYHAIVLLAAVNILFGRIQLWQILLLSLATIIPISAVMYRLVEVPSIELGRRARNQKANEGLEIPLTERLQPEHA
jgi:peptidoglycan/LPS O-acetylase OafA/YrhL